MKVLITGGSGFIGSNLSEYLLDRGHRVSAIGRSASRNRIHHEYFRYIEADTTRPGKWQKEIGEADAVVNLTGATIFKRWTVKYKKLIRDSRILTTRHVVAALPEAKKITLCNASGAGYYGNRGEDILKEDEGIGQDFLANLSRDWEKEALQATAKGTRVAVMRFGVVLGENGGALAKMIPAFKMFVGGPLGNGNQWFPWMHLED
ncbi:MAG: TIGR01777 family oxidoreductase, partial [Desulfobacterales bacterium]